MMKVLSIAAVALMIAGSSAFACGEKCEKKAEEDSSKKTACNEEKQECGKASKEKTACNESKKQCDKDSAEKSA
jgi:hypothetical protein